MSTTSLPAVEIATDPAAAVRAFVDGDIAAARAEYDRWLRHRDPDAVEWDVPELVGDLRERARALGLWNLHRTLPAVDFLAAAEETGRAVQLAPEAINAMAPDVENMTMLERFGTAAQRERWLTPLLDGTIRSGFAIAEADVATSDPTGARTRATADGGDLLVSGRKYFVANAPDRRCAVFLVLATTDADAPPGRRQSIVLVPRDAPGVSVVRTLTVLGFTDHHGYAEVAFDDVRVPGDAVLGPAGGALEVLAARQGAGRIHFCGRLLGMADRAVAITAERVGSRAARGRLLADEGVVRERVGLARIELEQARLLVRDAAAAVDAGIAAGSTAFAAAKVVVPRTACAVLDGMMQLHGGSGVTGDTPLAFDYAYARTIRTAFGADELDVDTVARRELDHARAATLA